MNNFPKGNDLIVKWAIKYSDGTPFPLENYAWELCYSAGRGINVVKDTAVISVSDNLLTWRFSGKDQVFYGKYSLTLRLYQQGKIVATVSKNNAFELSTTQYDGSCDIDLVSYCDNISLQDALLRGNKAMEVAQDAKVIAGSAVNTAGAAVTTANEAKSIANTANATSTEAKTIAGNAKTVADQAKTTADAAAATATQKAEEVAQKEAQLEAALNNLSPDQSGALALSTKVNEHGEKLSELNEKVDALALGAFYGYFPDSSSLPVDVTTPGYAYVGSDNPYEIWNFNGESWSDSGTSIDMNDADEEDITRNADGKLQFKDRAYGDGMGYVILRKDKTFAEQVTQANTIYEIRYDFDLNGAKVEIPENCVLKFNGGKISNVQFTRRLANDYVMPEWFGAVGNGTTDDTQAIQTAIDCCENVVFSTKVYLVSNGHNVSWQDFYALTLHQSTHNLHGNGATIKLKTNTLRYYSVFRITATDSCILENFTIIGDKDTHINPSEFGFGVLVDYGNKFVNVRNCDISKMIGDAIILDKYYPQEDSNTIIIENCNLHDCRRQGISILNGENVFVRNCVIANIVGTAPQSGIDIEPVQHNLLHTTIEGCHFLDCVLGLAISLGTLTGKVNTINVSHCDFQNCGAVVSGSSGANINMSGITMKRGVVGIKANPSGGFINIDARCLDVVRQDGVQAIIFIGDGNPIYNVVYNVYLIEATDSAVMDDSSIFGSNSTLYSQLIDSDFSVKGIVKDAKLLNLGFNVSFENLGVCELSKRDSPIYLSERYYKKYVCSGTPVMSTGQYLLIISNKYRGKPTIFEIENRHTEQILVYMNDANRFIAAKTKYIFYIDENGHVQELSNYAIS